MFARDAGFVPFVARTEDGRTHWWLQHAETGEIVDPTAPQLDNDRVYSTGGRQAFLTQDPSKRARELIGRAKSVEADRR